MSKERVAGKKVKIFFFSVWLLFIYSFKWIKNLGDLKPPVLFESSIFNLSPAVDSFVFELNAAGVESALGREKTVVFRG